MVIVSGTHRAHAEVIYRYLWRLIGSTQGEKEAAVGRAEEDPGPRPPVYLELRAFALNEGHCKLAFAARHNDSVQRRAHRY